jgi:hypothetical protein
MPNITAPALSFPARSFPVQQAGAPCGVVGELGFSALLGKYSTLVKSQKVFYTTCIVTSPVIYTSASQIGPVLWNKPASGIDAHLLGFSIGSPTTATSVAGSWGWTQNVQATQPTATITNLLTQNAYAGGGPSQLAGVLTTTGAVGILPTPVFIPFIGVNTGAITTQVIGGGYVDVGGMFIIGPGNMGCATVSATLTSGVFTVGLLWAELPA